MGIPEGHDMPRDRQVGQADFKPEFAALGWGGPEKKVESGGAVSAAEGASGGSAGGRSCQGVAGRRASQKGEGPAWDMSCGAQRMIMRDACLSLVLFQGLAVLQQGAAGRRLNEICGLVQDFYFPVDAIAQLTLGGFQIVTDLHAKPDDGAGAEVTGQAHGGVNRDCALPMDNLADANWCNANITRQAVLSQAERLHEVFEQDLAGMDWGKFFIHGNLLI
jgi:hypothetical protein